MKKLHWTDSEFDRTYFLLILIFDILDIVCTANYYERINE